MRGQRLTYERHIEQLRVNEPETMGMNVSNEILTASMLFFLNSSKPIFQFKRVKFILRKLKNTLFLKK